MNTPITIRLELDEQDADLLGTCRSRVFVRDQPRRFEPHGVGDHLSPSWEGGTMTWCSSAAEALLVRGYERASGFDTMILWDLATAESCTHCPDAWVVLSTRSFPPLEHVGRPSA